MMRRSHSSHRARGPQPGLGRVKVDLSFRAVILLGLEPRFKRSKGILENAE